ncbi:MAG: cupin domain-containing protein [Myxococcota bacterium]|nr:cupin domain-containing protein [Myxococcota bacterium]
MRRPAVLVLAAVGLAFAARSAQTPPPPLLEGHGVMRLGDEERPIGQGSILWVPKGTVHTFRNESRAPAIAYAVYVPAFDGEDRVVVE